MPRKKKEIKEEVKKVEEAPQDDKVEASEAVEKAPLCRFCEREGCFSGPGVNHEPFSAGGKAEQMWKNLCSQEKIALFVPFEAGENPDSLASQIGGVCLNGLKVNVLKGVYVQVPKQVFEVLASSQKQLRKAVQGASVLNKDTGREVLVNLQGISPEDADRGGAFAGTV